MRTISRTLIAAGVVAATAAVAQAETPPPIKPGLWEVQVERDAATPQMPDMSEQLKNMPPEQRKQLEAMMKERGVDMSAGAGKLRICLDKASLDQGAWQGEQAGCKTEVISRSSTSWKWHSVCTGPYAADSTGEAIFADAEHYTVKTSTTMKIKGQTKTTQNTIHSKWVGGDCGEVKSIQSLKAPTK